MKNVILMLIMSTILSASLTFADCPPINAIHADQDGHFVAEGLGGIWRDPDPIGNRPIPPYIYMFSDAFAKPAMENPLIANNLRCIYNSGTIYMINLYAPSPEQQYVLGSEEAWRNAGSGFKLCHANDNCQFSQS